MHLSCKMHFCIIQIYTSIIVMHFNSLFILCVSRWQRKIGDGSCGIEMTIGGVGSKDGVFTPARMAWQTTFPHPCPLGFVRPHSPSKTLLCVNLPHLAPHQLQFFISKICFININILKITIKFITSNQTIF